MARRHAGLVVSIARRFSGRAELADLYQAGCVGLIKALRNYDPGMGTAFTTYAVPTITGEIIDYLRGNGPIHVPRTIRESAQTCMKVLDGLRAEFGREPTASEIGGRAGLTAPEVVFALESLERPLSLSAPASATEHDSPLLQFIAAKNEDPSEEACRNVWVRLALAKLPELQRRVVILRFFCNLSQTQAAATLGCSQAHVHRMEKAALRFLRTELACE